MKAKYSFTVAGQLVKFISDEDKDFVKAVVKEVDENVTNAIINSSKISKNEAALLCAFEYCSEKNKAEKKIKSLEAQISLYEETIRRLKSKNEAEKIEKAQCSIAEVEPTVEVETKKEEPVKQVVSEKPVDLNEENRKAAKLKEIEALLRGKK